MPRKTDTIPLKNPFLSRRVKLLPCQKEMIRYWYETQGISIHGLSKMFKVSRRLIQFILFPERHVKNKELREDRGGSMVYYKKEKHKVAMKDHRDYKKEVFKDKEKKP